MRINTNSVTTSISEYSAFDQINGEHPYKNLGSHGYIEYEVMKLNKGSVVYFNFELAKDMGFISKNHPAEMNPELHEKLIETFSLQIINEYDILNKKRIAKNNIKANKYMATRYLQLQHKSKTGLTSGDGRSIWNGYCQHNNQTWDISSRGTGVTILSPGASAKNKPLKTGNTETGYGCGQAEIDELIGSAIMSEVLHHKGINTERVLCIIDLGKGVGIGVRAGMNLLRPAHAFLYLKQSKKIELKKVIDYYIQRQALNKKINLTKNIFYPKISHREKPHFEKFMYQKFLKHFVSDLAKFTAFAEENYLFVWMDWDGDNLLMDAGIIDYGSIRHFGTCHNKYKYDDVERYSTNLTEQKNKAKILVKEMVQAVDFIKRGNKKPLASYNNAEEIKYFHKQLKYYSLYFFAEKIGLSHEHINFCFKNKALFKILNKLKAEFYFWENLKISKGLVSVPDGINHFPLVNMRTFTRELPQILKENKPFTITDFCQLAQTHFCKVKDEKIFYKNEARFLNLMKSFKAIYKKLQLLDSEESTETLIQRINQQHPENFLTGNSLIHCVDDIINAYTISKKPELVQKTIARLIDYTQGTIAFNRKRHFFSLNDEGSFQDKKLWDKIIMNLHEYCEDI